GPWGVGAWGVGAREMMTTEGTMLGWQGWQVRLPREWNPVRLDGTFDAGQVLVADLHRPQIGLRWSRFHPEAATTTDFLRDVMRGEAGAAAAESARAGERDGGAALTFLDHETPGRDVHLWAAPSGRLLQIVYHAPRRDDVLERELLPTLAETAARPARPWSVYDLSCRVPAQYALVSHRLNAGDLTLRFVAPAGPPAPVTPPGPTDPRGPTDLHGPAALRAVRGPRRREFLNVRQIALARLALKRMRLAQWVDAQERDFLNGRYKPVAEMTVRQEVRRTSRRRRRFAFMPWLAPRVVTLARHDVARDRLIIVQASDESVATAVADAVGGVECVS
ncbi:MAG TPA: hypothetical protein VER17_00330, partial [Tepidisphaeraceae bacterium]|nr:hypothetical protein [Tepidisphaeraceae bacterium]